jgi:hypothetical protein
VVEVARQEPPKVRFGSYLLHDRIGVGGMAEIFLATTPSPQGVDRELVIKRILPALSHDDQFVKMFVEEARLCVNLRHPNIVQVYDLGEVDHQYFIAMEYVHGRDLLKTLAACARRRIGFPTDLALYIVMEVLKGLDYAHNLRGQDGKPLGIIHRDVSPSNVLLSFDGRVKLADFGIAKATTRERTATGVLKGKFGYMAPEQVIGRPMDHRADVFAVGILLYELLTGHRLFAARNDIAVIERVRDALIEPPPRHYNPELPHELEAMVLRALAREPRDRFQSTFELHEALYGYTFKRGVVVTARTLSRFLHDLFLNESTEEHYGASAAKNRAEAIRAFPSLAPPGLGVSGIGASGRGAGRAAQPAPGRGAGPTAPRGRRRARSSPAGVVAGHRARPVQRGVDREPGLRRRRPDRRQPRGEDVAVPGRGAGQALVRRLDRVRGRARPGDRELARSRARGGHRARAHPRRRRRRSRGATRRRARARRAARRARARGRVPGARGARAPAPRRGGRRDRARPRG